MEPSITHVEGVAVPFVNPNPPQVLSVIQHDPVTVTETLNQQMVAQQQLIASQQPAPTRSIPEMTADIAHQTASASPTRDFGDSVGWGRKDGNIDHIRRATEEARQATQLFNSQNNVRSMAYTPQKMEGSIGGPKQASPNATRSVGPNFDFHKYTPQQEVTDHVVRRRKAVAEEIHGTARYENNVNGAVRKLALNNKSGPRFDGTPAAALTVGGGEHGGGPNTKYQLNASQPGLLAGSPKTRGGGFAQPKKAFAYDTTTNVIRTELDKEDYVLHPHRTLDEHRSNTRAETATFAQRGWSPVRHR